MSNISINKILWRIIAGLSLFVALMGINNPSFYNKILPGEFLPGAIAQDFLTVVVSCLLFYLIQTSTPYTVKKNLLILGIIGSLWYLYAIYSIEQAYNELYLLYLAIFAISSFSIPISINSLNQANQDYWSTNHIFRNITSIFSFLIALLFGFLWISALLPLMQTGNQIEHLFSIYILDLCFVMPGFVITGYYNYKNKDIGLLLTPVMYILGIFVIFPLGLGEVVKPLYNYPSDVSGMIMSFVLSFIFLALSIVAFLNLKQKVRTL